MGALLTELGEKAIRLRRNGNELVVIGDPEVLNPSLLKELRDHKATLLRLIDNNIEIPRPSVAITPEKLTLVNLTQEEIDSIVGTVPGGATNLQDIYPLAPLQEGVLFHHLLGGEGDPYLQAVQLSFDSRERLDSYVAALQAVVDRHDILRTAVLWEGLAEPVQVVWRTAPLQIEEIELEPGGGDAGEQLYARFNPRRFRIEVSRAPLLRLYLAYDRERERWLMMVLLHHLAGGIRHERWR